MTRAKISGKRRWLLGVAALMALAPLAAVIAPGHTRWLAAEGLQLFYDSIEQHSATSFGPAPAVGLTGEQVEYQLTGIDPGRSWAVVNDVPNEPSSLRFAYEDPAHIDVSGFRERTEDLVSEPLDILEVARRVRAMTVHRYDTTTNDLLEILEHGRAGHGLICHQFARLFGTVLSARGYATRIVSLSSTGAVFDHALCEVYDHARAKWIAVDVDFSLVYQRDGQVLNAVEIQDAWKQVREEVGIAFDLGDKPRAVSAARIQQMTGIEMVSFAEIEPGLRAERLAQSPSGLNLELFEFVFLAGRDDYLTRDYPMGHPKRVRQLCFRADGRDDEISDVCPEAVFPTLNEAYAPVGACEIAINAVNPRLAVELEFGTRTPNFLLFEYSIDSAPWNGTAAARLTWQLHGGTENQVRVRSVNSAGIRGAVTTLSIRSSWGESSLSTGATLTTAR